MSRRDRRMIRSLVSGIGVVALMTLAGCGGSGQASDSNASDKKDGLYVYSLITPEDADALTAAFKKVHPEIELTFDRRPTPALEAVIEAEGAGGKPLGDVYLTPSKPWLLAHTSLLTPISSASLDDPQWAPFAAKDRTFVDFQFIPLVVAYNTGTLKGGLDSVDAVASLPDNVAVGIPDPSVSEGTRAFLMQKSAELGDDWLDGTATGARLYESTAPLAQALTSGEVDVAIPMLGNVIDGLKAQGAPVDAIALDPAMSIRISAAVLASAPHPKEAQTFIDFVLSKAGQEALSAGKSSPLPDVPGAAGQVSKDDLSVDLLKFGREEQDKFLSRFTALVGK